MGGRKRKAVLRPSTASPPDPNADALFERVSEIIEAARTHVCRTVNTAMVHAYWLIGREIIEVEQKGKERAEYGEQVLRHLARRLGDRYGRGFSYPNVKRMRQFYLAFRDGSSATAQIGGPSGQPADADDGAVQKGSTTSSLSAASGQIGSTPSSPFAAGEVLFPPTLSWSHYVVLMRVEQSLARSFYEIEAAREGWSVRELERQVASLLFERLAKSRDEEKVRAMATVGQQVTKPQDVLKDPMVLEFLELEERASWLERDLEQAIIDRLESFLLELGKGFCFVARQKRLTLDGDHFYADLVFYNRLLRCFVVIDLKLGKLTHQDIGQMQMYVNYFDRHQREEWESPTVGIVLCSDKNEAMVRITLPEGDEQIHAARYQFYLPTEGQLRDELVAERERVEQTRRLMAGEPTNGTSGRGAR